MFIISPAQSNDSWKIYLLPFFFLFLFLTEAMANSISDFYIDLFKSQVSLAYSIYDKILKIVVGVIHLHDIYGLFEINKIYSLNTRRM